MTISDWELYGLLFGLAFLVLAFIGNSSFLTRADSFYGRVIGWTAIGLIAGILINGLILGAVLGIIVCIIVTTNG